MWLVRAVRVDDLDSLHQLVQSATRGLTSLQLDRSQLLDRVEHSEFAFSRSGLSPRGEPFVLVMVDADSDQIVGTSTIYAKSGGYQPLYAYRLVETTHHSEQLAVTHQRRSLQLERIHDGPTEIGSLFLRGKYRGQGRGRWLSLARFAIIAMLRHRFADQVIAEMRGKANEDGSVPFWDAVGSRFFKTDFATADALSTVSKQFIEELIPQHPIYLDLLDRSISDQIGQVHEETVPAIELLKSEGFRNTAFVDIFDAGPMIRCQTDEIDAVRRCHRIEISKVVDQPIERDRGKILCNNHAGFTSVLAACKESDQGLVIDRPTASALRVEPGDSIWRLSPYPQD